MKYTSEQIRHAVTALAVVLFFCSLAFFVSLPVTDTDFWWHLASGKWMWENRSLLHDDPFMIPYSFPDSGFRKDFILTQYWLSQLVLNGVYAIGGFWGVIIMRIAVVTAMFSLLYRFLRKEGANRSLGLGLVFLSSLVIVKEFGYIADKPQLWSSLFSIAIIGLLDAAREKKRWAYASLPVLMLLWANMHGGYVFGMAIIALYAAGVALGGAGHRNFYLACLGAGLACGLNPNAYSAVIMVARSMVDPAYKKYLDSIVETQSIFSHASLAGILRSLPALTAFGGIVLLSILLSLKYLWKERRWLLLPALLVSAMAFMSIRYLIFFVLLGALAAGAGISALLRSGIAERLWARVPRREAAAAVLVVACAITFSAFYISWGSEATGFQYDRPYDDSFGEAVRFIRAEKVTGKMFNDFNKGGYLIWWLWPEVRVAMDTRNLYNELYAINNAVSDHPFAPYSPGGNDPVYRRFLDDHGIDLILIPGCDPVSGVPIMLAYALLKDSSWQLVHADPNALLFMRDSMRNRDFIVGHRAPADAAYMNMIGLALQASQNPHAQMVPGWRLSFAIAFKGLGNYEKALFWLGEYQKLVPFDEFAYNLKAEIMAGQAALPRNTQ